MWTHIRALSTRQELKALVSKYNKNITWTKHRSYEGRLYQLNRQRRKVPKCTQCPEEGSRLQHLEVCAVNTAVGVTSLSVLCRGFKTFQSKHHLNRARATTKNSEERKALTTWFLRQAGARVWAAGGFLLACICQHHREGGLCGLPRARAQRLTSCPV